jgi:mannose-1-phosphate guanylyltransferase/phosphomannomutase
MKTIIMAGGFGTRLRPLTCNLPKPMVYIANKPMMEHIITLLKKHGLTDLVVLLYFQPEDITSYFGDGSKWGVKIEYVTAVEDFGTAGSVKNAEKFLNGRFLVISGDVLTDIDLKKAIDFHIEKKAQATMVLSRKENPLSYGVVITRENGEIDRFLEKPTWGQVFSDTINTGIYILEPEVLEKIPAQKSFDFSKNLFPLMLKEKRPLFGYIAPNYWKDVGNLEEYARAHQDILEEKVKVEINGNLLQKNGSSVWAGKNLKLGKNVKFTGTVILGNDCVIGSKSIISNSIFGDRVKIGEESNITRSTIWRDTKIGSRVNITESVVGNNVLIEDEAVLSENTIISEDSRIGFRAEIKANVKVWPGKEVESDSILSSSLVWGERWNRELFTDAKVIGLANVEVTPEFAVKLGAAFGAVLGKGSSVVVSRDAGRTSRMTNRALICGLLSTGVHVSDLRTLPIPLVRFELKSGREKGGIYVRISPLDKRQTDIIFFNSGGLDLPTAKSKSVERLFFREDFRRASPEETGKIIYPQRIRESYRESFLKAIHANLIRKAKFKIVVDYSNGGASEIFPAIFGALGCDVISLNAYLDPKRLFRTEAEINQSLDQLSSIVKTLKADAGFLLDAGAEKIRAVDEKGKSIDNDLLLLIVTSLFLSSHPAKKIAVPVVASMGMERIASEYGVKVIRVRNDHLAMMDAITSPGVDFVGGTKGGFIFPGFQSGADAMFDVVKILELMAKNKKKLGQVRQEVDKYFLLKKNIPCPWSKKGEVMRKLMEFTEDKTRELIDGVRILDDDSWVLVAPDRQKASFYILSESEKKSIAEKQLQEYSERVWEWQEQA